MRFHYYRQQWLATPQARHWQRFHFFWPNGQRRGIGVTVWARGDLWHDWLSSQGEVSFSSQDGPVSFHSGTDDSWLGLRVGVSALTSARVQLHGSLGAERSLDGEGFGADARLGAVFSW